MPFPAIVGKKGNGTVAVPYGVDLKLYHFAGRRRLFPHVESSTAPPTAGLSLLLDRKNMVVGGIEDPADQEDLIGIQVPLAHFYLGHGAPGYIAAFQLEFSG